MSREIQVQERNDRLIAISPKRRANSLQIRKLKAGRAWSHLPLLGSAWGSEDCGAKKHRASAQESSQM